MKTDFQSLATRLITQVFGSVAQQVTIRHPIYDNYDEESGSYISAFEEYVVTGIVGPWKNDNQDALTSNSNRYDDISLIISNVTLDLVPEMGVDTAVTADGTIWQIIYSEKDEAEATVTFRLSKEIEE